MGGLTFDMSGPEPAWPAKWNMNRRNVAGQAGGGPLDGRVRPRYALLRESFADDLRVLASNAN
jgi:hypothetical protein